MSNDYFNADGNPGTRSSVSSAVIRAEFTALAAAFDKLPPLTANKAVVVNAGGTALTVTAGSLSLAANFTLSGGAVTFGGSFTTTFAAQASVTLTLPATTGTLVLSASPTFTGTVTAAAVHVTGNVTVDGHVNKVTITAPATASTLTIADGKTLTASNTLILAGTDGKTLTVSNSLTLAGTDSTTFTMPPVSGNAGWFRYAEQDVSAVTSVDFTSIPATIKHLQFVLEGAVGTDGTILGARVYVSGVLKSGVTDYFNMNIAGASNNPSPTTNAAVGSFMGFTGGVNNGIHGVAVSGIIYNIQTTALRVKLTYQGYYVDTAATSAVSISGGGNYQTVGAIDGVRFISVGGTFTGKVTLMASF